MTTYGTGSGIADTIPDAPNVPLDSQERTFWGEVDKFKRKADEAYTLWQKLRARRQYAATNPTIEAEYNDVINQGEDIGAKISDVERMTAQVKEGVGDRISSWFGLEGMRHAQNQLGQVGFIQFAAIALVTGAIAWISSWIGKAYIVDRKLDSVENMIASGVDPREAGALVEEKGDPGAFALFAGNLGTGVAVAGVAAMLLYFFFEKKRGF
jgi:hypothetical protein